MRTATVHELKETLQQHTQGELLQLCLRLARFKKENKELLTYLLYEAGDTDAFITSVQEETDALFETVNRNQVYLAKKTLRKILRNLSKYSRFSGNPLVEAELHLHFCQLFLASGLPIQKHQVLKNMLLAQQKKICKAIQQLHEELQFDLNKKFLKLFP